jgi:hypothetical protein
MGSQPKTSGTDSLFSNNSQNLITNSGKKTEPFACNNPEYRIPGRSWGFILKTKSASVQNTPCHPVVQSQTVAKATTHIQSLKPNGKTPIC